MSKPVIGKSGGKAKHIVVPFNSQPDRVLGYHAAMQVQPTPFRKQVNASPGLVQRAKVAKKPVPPKNQSI